MTSSGVDHSLTLGTDKYLEPIAKERDPVYGALLMDSFEEEIADTQEESSHHSSGDQAEGAWGGLGRAEVVGQHAQLPSHGVSLATTVIANSASTIRMTADRTQTPSGRGSGNAASLATAVPAKDNEHGVREELSGAGTTHARSEPGPSGAAGHLLCNPKENQVPNWGHGGASTSHSLEAPDKRPPERPPPRPLPFQSPLNLLKPTSRASGEPEVGGTCEAGASGGAQLRGRCEAVAQLPAAGVVGEEEENSLMGAVRDLPEDSLMPDGLCGMELNVGCLGLAAAEAMTGKLVGELMPMSEIDPAMTGMPGNDVSLLNTAAFTSHVMVTPCVNPMKAVEKPNAAPRSTRRTEACAAEAPVGDRTRGFQGQDADARGSEGDAPQQSVAKRRTRASVAPDAEVGAQGR
jgi:hypothetical protein